MLSETLGRVVWNHVAPDIRETLEVSGAIPMRVITNNDPIAGVVREILAETCEVVPLDHKVSEKGVSFAGLCCIFRKHNQPTAY